MADSTFQREFLDAHNTYRRLHGSPPLTLSSELSAAAQRWAEHLLSLGLLSHSNGNVGENLYTAIKSDPLTANDAVGSWYNEVSNYDWSNPGMRSNTGHFTQLVWKDSTQLGVGVAIVGTRSYVVAQYKPAGNITNPGYFERNVLPKGSSGGSGSNNSPSGNGGTTKSHKKCALL